MVSGKEMLGPTMTDFRGLLLALCIGLLVPCHAFAQTNGNCPRPAAGSVVSPPPDLYSQNGVLQVALSYYTAVDSADRTLFCFVTADGAESPTLHANPGDTIQITLTNMIQNVPGAPADLISQGSTTVCLSNTMTPTSVNMHFHGLNVPPKCHSDDVIHTLVNSGQTFQYTINIPKDEPPGLYWYHPHVHGISSPAVQGGATGVIEVEGIANLQPIVAGLPERFLVIRDQPIGLTNVWGPDAPFWDVSLNYVPINFPGYVPSVIQMNPGTQEFWRVANTSADTIMDLKLTYDGQVQPVTLVALDGVPVGSQDGKRQGTTIPESDVYIPPAGRAEFIVTGPTASVKSAVLSTAAIDTGPAGDNDPARPLATIQLTQAKLNLPLTQERTGPPNPQRFEDLSTAKVTAHRKLYFSEFNRDTDKAGSKVHAPGPDQGEFFITVEGQEPRLFSPNEPPAIITKQGSVEDWTIENQTEEVHEFHIHQIHFLLLKIDGKPVPKAQQQFYDTYQVPYWKGFRKHGDHYPSITVRMDFRGQITGDFVYHCHILDHEDLGMMAIIRVLPKS
jgi:FtsP/CotA-like multicopper oxidase with cupredoxin domain